MCSAWRNVEEFHPDQLARTDSGVAAAERAAAVPARSVPRRQASGRARSIQIVRQCLARGSVEYNAMRIGRLLGHNRAASATPERGDVGRVQLEVQEMHG